jgi:hypothetical protein
MTPEELNNIGIRQWELLRPKYKEPDLLLGNGFSISLSDKFKYTSLFETFIGKTKDAFKDLFKHFDTTNFELILSYLTNASKVNEILEYPTDLIKQATEDLKNGLIESIKEIHPRVEDINWEKLESITNQLEYFGDIYSTNYDLYLYHIIMKSIDISREKKGYVAFQDYFWGNAEDGYKQFMPYQNYRYKHIYYLHGALCIFNHNIRDLKIKRDNAAVELIEIISAEIQKGHFPLFVTEGTAQDKLNSIYRSNYLYFCLQKLKTNKKSPLIVFGNSLSPFDSHIVQALISSQRELIISVYTQGRQEAEIQHDKYSILTQFNNYKPAIEFIDSSTLFAD